MNATQLKEHIKRLTGEDPEDILGPDWESTAESFLDEKRDGKIKND